MEVTKEGRDHIKSRGFKAALADSVWTQLYVHGVNRKELREVFCRSLAGQLLLLSNRRGRAQVMPDVEPIYQAHKALIDGIMAEAFEIADETQHDLSGKK